MNKTIRVMYTIFLGILLAIFVGVGISAFYEEPKGPAYPAELSYPVTKERTTKEEKLTLEMQKEFDTKQKAFEKEMRYYNRNVSIIAIISAVTFLILSLTFAKKIMLIADGLLIGGVLTLGYSIIRGFDTEGNKYRFLVVSVGLLAALIVGYLKFIKPVEGKE